MQHARLKPEHADRYPELDPDTWYGVLALRYGGVWLSACPLAWVPKEHCEIREDPPLPSSLNRPH